MTGDAAPSVDVVLLGGPTASGKSGVALALAAALRGTIINADSMQLYRELAILTARPAAPEMALAPHRLYGFQPADRPLSAAAWRRLALAEIDAAAATGRVPIVVGGTGLYLAALLRGLSDVPAIPAEVRTAARARLDAIGHAAFHAELAGLDPALGDRLAPGDTQRMLRGWEVATATGRPLSAWQAAGRAAPPAGLRFHPVVTDPPRAGLYAASDRRFDAMMAAGGLEEVRALGRLGLDPELPLMKALGVPELLAHLAGQTSLEAARALARQRTRNYAKRQVTWFRNQLPEAPRLDPLGPGGPEATAQLSERLKQEIIRNIQNTD